MLYLVTPRSGTCRKGCRFSLPRALVPTVTASAMRATWKHISSRIFTITAIPGATRKEGTTGVLLFSSCEVWQIRRQKTCVVIHVQFYCLACVMAHMRGSRHDEVCRFHCRGTISFPCSILDIICRGVCLDTFVIHINDNRKNGRVNLARHCRLIYVWSPRVIRTDLHGHIEHINLIIARLCTSMITGSPPSLSCAIAILCTADAFGLGCNETFELKQVEFLPRFNHRTRRVPTRMFLGWRKDIPYTEPFLFRKLV